MICASALAADATTGRVFVDTNGNGNLDAGEKGVPGVAVSNGEGVVQTDAQGRYQIACNQSCVVFVSKPAGYRFPTDHNQLPQFYYLHSPSGSPGLRYGGIDQSGPMPSTLNFPLIENPAENHFRVLLFGDPQPANQTELNYFEHDIVDGLRNAPDIEFGITLGDLVHDDLSLFKPLNEVIGSIGIPWFSVPGNHDIDFDAPDDAASDDTYESVYGPGTYSMQVGRVHFIMLDNVLFEDGAYRAGLTERQFQFVRNDLELVRETDLVVLVMHIPLVDSVATPDGFDPAHRERLLGLLSRFPNTLSVSAHTHQQWHAYLGQEQGWTGQGEHHHFNVGTTSGSWWSGPPDDRGIPDATMQDGTPNGYAFINFRGTDYQIEYRAARSDRAYQMRLHAPRVVRRGTYPNANLVANVFIGSERTVVEFRVVGQTPWAPMRHVFLPDPVLAYRTALRDRASELLPGKRIGPALNSRHLWSVGLPTHLDNGRYDIEVRAHTQWGQTFTGTASYRVSSQ